MRNNKLTVNDIRDMIDSEGLGATIMDASFTQIEDPKLAAKMQEAREWMMEVEDYIEKNYVPDDLDDFDDDDDEPDEY